MGVNSIVTAEAQSPTPPSGWGATERHRMRTGHNAVRPTAQRPRPLHANRIPTPHRGLPHGGRVKSARLHRLIPAGRRCNHPIDPTTTSTADMPHTTGSPPRQDNKIRAGTIAHAPTRSAYRRLAHAALGERASSGSTRSVVPPPCSCRPRARVPSHTCTSSDAHRLHASAAALTDDGMKWPRSVSPTSSRVVHVRSSPGSLACSYAVATSTNRHGVESERASMP